MATKNYQVPNHTVQLQKGTVVVIPIFAIHRDPEFYPNPEEYRPERFEPEEVAKRPHCSFIPFGAGPRICIGKRFGLMQTRIGLAMLLKNFKFTLNEATKFPLDFTGHTFLLVSTGGLYFNIEKIE